MKKELVRKIIQRAGCEKIHFFILLEIFSHKLFESVGAHILKLNVIT